MAKQPEKKPASVVGKMRSLMSKQITVPKPDVEPDGMKARPGRAEKTRKK